MVTREAKRVLTWTLIEDLQDAINKGNPVTRIEMEPRDEEGRVRVNITFHPRVGPPYEKNAHHSGEDFTPEGARERMRLIISSVEAVHDASGAYFQPVKAQGSRLYQRKTKQLLPQTFDGPVILDAELETSPIVKIDAEVKPKAR